MVLNLVMVVNILLIIKCNSQREMLLFCALHSLRWVATGQLVKFLGEAESSHEY